MGAEIQGFSGSSFVIKLFLWSSSGEEDDDDATAVVWVDYSMVIPAKTAEGFFCRGPVVEIPF